MSSGSSHLDPAEFSEETHNVPEIDPTSEDEPILESPELREIRNSMRRRRRRRRRSLLPPPEVRFRIWIAQSPRDPPPNRRTLNQLISSISRCLRSGVSHLGPLGHRPAVTCRRSGSILTIDVHRLP
ncbi:hypothetical protein KR093_006825 [Drosophila rubida]|uniref:Uncharacterized protein n=1 Tax=Drosophila rubida TaxID=30044 RepID=A0AAD4K2R9_9MUSC|nr:hypothetical protein KR093_006825 [Drosophila rubida]